MRAKRIDENQHDIVRALRRIGCSVYITSGLGHDFPDLVVGFRGANYLVECKRSEKARLTQGQKRFFDHWLGQVTRINSVDDAIRFVQSVI
jgi:Holliday junction resolvase